MTTKNFVAKIWSARLLANLDNQLSALGLVNRDYEGEISQFGDTVYINQLGNISIKNYTGADIDAPEDLTSVQQTLAIDKAQYFNFQVKDIDAAQANVELVDKAMQRASYQLADAIDKDIYKAMAEGAGVKIGSASSPIALDKENIYDQIVDIAVAMNEKNVPKGNRKLVLPPFAIGMLAKDPRFTKQEAVLASGVVGRVAGMDIIESNNLKSTNTYVAAVAGVPEATAFANQVIETEAYRPESNYADAVKGLSVYGRSVVQKDALAVVYIKVGSASASTPAPTSPSTGA